MVTPAATKEELASLPIRQETLAQLQDLAGKENKSVLKYISDAISLKLWFDEQLKDGGKIIAKPKRGKSEVIIAR